MPVDIIVVGAGIAGLCAAISLRQAGHTVEVFEKSRFAAQFGAALGLTPNGSRVLSQLGFSFTRARACNLERWDVVDGVSLARMSSIDHRNSQERFGMPFMTIGRVDLHEELLRLALHTDETSDVKAVKLNLASKVVAADAQEGLIELENGEKHHADLIIAADGLHSVLKNAVLGQGAVTPLPTGTSAFRFLIPTKVIEEDPTLAIWLRSKGRASTILADTKDTVNERHMVWYECQGGEVQNFVGIHPTRSDVTDIDDEANSDNEKLSMLEEFAHFHPHVLQLIKLAPNVTRWPLSIHDPLTTWSKGRMVLIGDAAHPMMPFGGQGAMQAIEDGGALGYLLRGINDPLDIPQRLRLFEEVRLKRVSTVQILSKVRVGKEKEVEDELRPYADPPGSDVPGSFAERTAHDFGYDIFASCAAAIA